MKPHTKYCAIYTRKSSEEGLEQDFNSLDSQYEACQSYIFSQKSEGWIASKDRYDDGGFSGGNMERPGLKRLLEDIAANKINIIVVYKIDRLTRSLMDFARLVDVFDKYNVTFVSVTQSFNTTTSMGRLILNVLLSFAQFEREVTGERIRDKISASKKKGMWMGGSRPTGYEIINRQLVIKSDEADIIRIIFNKYLDFGCVRKLQEYLEENKIKTKLWTSAKGNIYGGCYFSRGILYKILSNPIYIGKIRHKEKIYDGLHDAIITDDLWTRVQKQLSDSAVLVRGHKKASAEGNYLKGILFDSHGNRYTPVFASKGGRQYRYYVKQSLLQNKKCINDVIDRIPSFELENLISRTLSENLSSVDKAAAMLNLDLLIYGENLNKLIQIKGNIQLLSSEFISKVIVYTKSISVILRQDNLLQYISQEIQCNLKAISNRDTFEISIPFEPIRSHCSFIIPSQQEKCSRSKDPFDIPAQQLKNWVRGVIWRNEYFSGKSFSDIAKREKCSRSLVIKLITKSLEII